MLVHLTVKSSFISDQTRCPESRLLRDKAAPTISLAAESAPFILCQELKHHNALSCSVPWDVTTSDHVL